MPEERVIEHASVTESAVCEHDDEPIDTDVAAAGDEDKSQVCNRCIAFFLEKQFLSMHSGADDIAEN